MRARPRRDAHDERETTWRPPMALVPSDDSYPTLTLVAGGAAQVVGRKHGALVLSTSIKVSKLHCQLWMTADSVAFVHDSSANGTWINGTRMKKDVDYALNPGDQISFPAPPGVAVPTLTFTVPAEPAELADEGGAADDSCATHLAAQPTASSITPTASSASALTDPSVDGEANSEADAAAAGTAADGSNLTRRGWDEPGASAGDDLVVLKRRPLAAEEAAEASSPHAPLRRRQLTGEPEAADEPNGAAVGGVAGGCAAAGGSAGRPDDHRATAPRRVALALGRQRALRDG